MDSGLPVIASDLAVHREICGDAAVYFPRFSPDGLAEGIVQVASSPEKMKSMAAAGTARSRQFSWSDHVVKIITLCREIIESRGGKT
jgi:glycosyltransferase involved in cell wall biosynthesis